MRPVAKLVVALLLAPAAAAQNASTAPAELTGVKVSNQSGTEVRIELTTSNPVASPEVVATYRDSLVLELPGAVYHALPKRIRVDCAGIRAVRVWMQSENPPSTHVVVEIDRAEEYAVTSAGNSVVLRVGPALQGLPPAEVHSTAEAFGRHTPAVAARSASVAGALSGIFHRGPAKPAAYKGAEGRRPSASGSTPPPANDGATKAASAQDSTPGSPTLPSPVLGSPATTAESLSAAVNPETPAPQSPAATVATEGNLPAAPQSNSGVTPSPDGQQAVAAVFPSAGGETRSVSSERKSLATTEGGQPGVGALPQGAPPVEAVASKPEAASAAINPSETIPPSSAPNAASAASPNNSPAESAIPTTVAAAASAALASGSKGDAWPEPTSTPTGGAPPAPSDMLAVMPVANPGMRTEFHVKFVEEESAYIDGGRSAGLAEGMKLLVRAEASGAGSQAGAGGGVAELVVIGVAETSAVTEIHNPQRAVIPGDIAYLSSESIETLVQQHAMGATRSYPAVVTFSEGGDALDEEAHAFVPRPPLPSVNHATGRLGFDYTGTKSTDASQINSSSFGAIVRVDFTRMGGTYWDLRGYWRGRLLSSSAASQQTLQDLLNRTYHLSLTYENPNSRWVLGVGRMYLPWAVSLETIDGGYFGGRLGHGTTLGFFGGSTPDPTSWNYNPSRHLGGAFFNAEGGSFDGFHYSSTVGLGEDLENVQYTTTTSTGTSTSTYQNNRPFAFIENSFSHKRSFSFFQALQADRPSSNPVVPSPGPGISRSFTTLRIEPISRVEFSANHTYFRDVPTFDATLIGTGLLDKYLFQGFSGGVRVEPIKKIFLYTDLGRSSRTGDAKSSLNQLFGITFGELPKLGIRVDAHYSRFTSSFGSGIYRAFSLSRSLGDRLHFEAIGGDQNFMSSLAGNQSAKFFTANVDSSLGALFFVQSGFTMYRGQFQNYNQTYAAIGYRFDSKWKHK